MRAGRAEQAMFTMAIRRVARREWGVVAGASAQLEAQRYAVGRVCMGLKANEPDKKALNDQTITDGDTDE
jgi:hypothetical protein